MSHSEPCAYSYVLMCNCGTCGVTMLVLKLRQASISRAQLVHKPSLFKAKQNEYPISLLYVKSFYRGLWNILCRASQTLGTTKEC